MALLLPPAARSAIGPPEAEVPARDAELLGTVRRRAARHAGARAGSVYRHRPRAFLLLRESVRKLQASRAVFQRAVAILDRYCAAIGRKNLRGHWRLIDVVAAIAVKICDTPDRFEFNLDRIQRNDLTRLVKQEMRVLAAIDFEPWGDPTPVEWFLAAYGRVPDTVELDHMEGSMSASAEWSAEAAATAAFELGR
jgi:hypothetical protein